MKGLLFVFILACCVLTWPMLVDLVRASHRWYQEMKMRRGRYRDLRRRPPDEDKS